MAKAGQLEAVEEFFELFKTPWEPYRSGRRYDVVVVSDDSVPDIQTKLLLVCNSANLEFDSRAGFLGHDRKRGVKLTYEDSDFPVYNSVLTFMGCPQDATCVRSSAGPVGVLRENPGSVLIRLGYDLFEEVRFLLQGDQPLVEAHVPTLDIHIQMLRNWILEAGIPLLEIPPTPIGHTFIICLTHDIDFIGIRNQKLGHSILGFIYRASAGSLRNFLRGRISLRSLVKNWFAVASLPFVFIGWAKDFWEPFEWYLEVEKDIPATYFLIPFKRRCGDNVPGPHAVRRGTSYDIGDIPSWTNELLNKGCEVGVHGIDAWHNVEKAREELTKVNGATGSFETGIRMHWLLRDPNTPSTLERAGFVYDSTIGYNETIGYRAGTGQVFRPAGAHTLLELPLHIQDGALFYPQRLNLTERAAEAQCQRLIDDATKNGGVLTVLWHDRSHGPERFWGDFYVKLVQTLKATDGWFATGSQAVGWFQQRRNVKFAFDETNESISVCLNGNSGEILPPLKLRIYKPIRERSGALGRMDQAVVEIPWNGEPSEEVEMQINSALSSPSLEDHFATLHESSLHRHTVGL